MLLRWFADGGERLVMVARQPPHASRHISLTRACAESDKALRAAFRDNA